MAKWYCGTWAWLNKESGEVKRYYCGLGRCDRPECQKLFWLRRVRLISALIPKYHLDKFFTLTMDRSLSKEEAWEKIASVWHKCRTGLKRDYLGFNYVAILEAHKDGYPHIHGFTNTWIATKEWSRRFSNCGGGKIAWIEKVRSGDISEYVSKQLNIAKYVGKSQVVTAQKYLEKCKRSFWRSKGLKADFESEKGKGNWSLEKGTYFISEKELDKLYKVEYNRESGYCLTQVLKPFSKESLCLLKRLRKESPLQSGINSARDICPKL